MESMAQTAIQPPQPRLIPLRQTLQSSAELAALDGFRAVMVIKPTYSIIFIVLSGSSAGAAACSLYSKRAKLQPKNEPTTARAVKFFCDVSQHIRTRNTPATLLGLSSTWAFGLWLKETPCVPCCA